LDIFRSDRMFFLVFASSRIIGGLGFGLFYLIPKYFTKGNLEAIVFWGPNRSIVNPISKRLFVIGIIVAVCTGIGWTGLVDLFIVVVTEFLRTGR